MKRIRAYEHNETDQLIPFGRGSVALPVVSDATRDHERSAVRNDCYRVSWQNWRSVCRQRTKNLAFLGPQHWKAVY